ncbi:MAG: dihydrofolate reductase family protein [Thermoflexales bacterium]|nr:dihydrofolate reductase family protein [Thermoflexales bacterium]
MNRPQVVIFSTASVDGRLTLASNVMLLYGDERWPSTSGSSMAYNWLQHTHKPQATLEGSGSFVPENATPEPLPPVDSNPQVLYQDFLPAAVVQRPGHRGWFTVVDGRGRVRWVYKEHPSEEWAGWHLLVLVGHHTPPEYLAYLRRENIPYLVAGEQVAGEQVAVKQRVDLGAALEKLKSSLGVTCVLSTAGGRLNGALLRAGLVDEVNIEFFPAIIGGLETPSLFDAPALQPEEWPTQLRLLSAHCHTEGQVWLRYQVISEGNKS